MKTSVLGQVLMAVTVSSLAAMPAWAGGGMATLDDNDGQMLAFALGVVGAVGLMRRRMGPGQP